MEEEEHEEEEALARDVGRKGGLGALEHAVAHVTALRKHDAELWGTVLETVGAYRSDDIDGSTGGNDDRGKGPRRQGSEEL